MQYLYEADGAYTFMDNETYDQVELNLEQLGEAKNFLLENMEVSIVFFQGIVIGIDLPVAVELRVVETALVSVAIPQQVVTNRLHWNRLCC